MTYENLIIAMLGIIISLIAVIYLSLRENDKRMEAKMDTLAGHREGCLKLFAQAQVVHEGQRAMWEEISKQHETIQQHGKDIVYLKTRVGL